MSDSTSLVDLDSPESTSTIGIGTDSALNKTSTPVPQSIAFIILILVSTLGNFFVLLAACLHRSLLRTTANYFLTNLAVADFLVSTLIMPFAAFTTVYNGVWVFGETYCSIWIMLDVWLQSASILSMCAISLDRYVGVTRPLWYPVLMTRRRAAMLIAFVWILSGCSTPPVFRWGVVQSQSNNGKGVCNYYFDTEDVVFITLGVFFIPMVIVIIFYWNIFQVVRAHEKSKKVGQIGRGGGGENGAAEMMRVHRGGYNNGQLQATAAGSEAAAPAPRPNLSTPITLLLSKFQNQKKVSKQLGFCVGAFILCWMPYFTVELLIGLGVVTSGSIRSYHIFVWFGYFNSCLNPFIYVASSKQYREALRRLFGLGDKNRDSSSPQSNNQSQGQAND